MTADPTAPKIDTTREAVERLAEFHDGIAKSYDDYIRGPYTTTKANHMSVAATLRALLAERDLAAAQTAAAVREALLPTIKAARQDERTAIAAYIGMSPSEVTDRQYHMEAIRTGRYRDDPLMQRGGRMEGGDG